MGSERVGHRSPMLRTVTRVIGSGAEQKGQGSVDLHGLMHGPHGYHN